MSTTPTSTRPARKLFVNLPIRNLKRSVEFFTKLGFTFNQQFTDATTTCMIVSEEAYFMLLEDSRFKDFTTRQICDSRTHTEAMLAVNANSRDEVDDFVNKALAAGGTPAMPKMDMGFMYGWSFYDIDGHHWEVMWMDPSHIQKTE